MNSIVRRQRIRTSTFNNLPSQPYSVLKQEIPPILRTGTIPEVKDPDHSSVQASKRNRIANKPAATMKALQNGQHHEQTWNLKVKSHSTP